jgi:hypothetical protein
MTGYLLNILIIIFINLLASDGFMWRGLNPRISKVLKRTLAKVISPSRSLSEVVAQTKRKISKANPEKCDSLVRYSDYWSALKAAKVDRDGVLRVGMEIPLLPKYRFSPEETNKVIVRPDYQRLWQQMQQMYRFEDVRQFVIRVSKGVGRRFFLQYLLYELSQKPEVLKAGILYSRGRESEGESGSPLQSSSKKAANILNFDINFNFNGGSRKKSEIEYILFSDQGVKRITDVNELIKVTSATKAWWLMDKGGHDSQFLPFAECRVVYMMRPRDELDDSNVPLLNLPVAVQLGLPPWNYGIYDDSEINAVEDDKDDQNAEMVSGVGPNGASKAKLSNDKINRESMPSIGSENHDETATASLQSIGITLKKTSKDASMMDGLSDELKLLICECYPSFNNPDDIANIKFAADLWGPIPCKLFKRRSREELVEAKKIILKAIEEGAVTLTDYIHAQSTLSDQDDNDPVLKLMRPSVDRISYRIVGNEANSPYIKTKILDRIRRYEGELLAQMVKSKKIHGHGL